MKQKIGKQIPKDNNGFEMKAVKTAQSMGKKVIPALYKKALSESFDDMRILEKGLKKIRTENKNNISLVLSSGEELEGMTKEDIKNMLNSIRERAKIKALFYIQEYLGEMVKKAKSTGNIKYIEDLTYEETSDLDLLLNSKDSFFDDISTMIRNYSIKEVQNIIDKEITERKMNFVDLLEGYKKLPYVLDLDRKIDECKNIIWQIRMKSYFEGKKDIDYKEERIVKFKLEQIEEFEKQKYVLLEDQKKGSRELAIVYRLEKLKDYRIQFETQGFVMLPSRQRIYDEIMGEILNGNSTLITGHTGTGKTMLAVKMSKNLQEKFFEYFIVTQDLFDEIAINKEYITLLAIAAGKTEQQVQNILGLDIHEKIDEKHKKNFLGLIKTIQKKFPDKLEKRLKDIKNDNAKSKEFEQLTKTLHYNPTFVEVLSGNSGMTVGEISAKLGLEGDGKGGTRTTTQIGKLLKAMSQGKLPIFDEINLVPTDTIMRTKHIFTLNPGEEFSPQEGQGEIINIQNPTLIATGNLGSKYERNKIDPAVIRLLGGIEATYFDRNETYDIALVSLMDKEGFIAGVDKGFLIGDQAPLIKLIEALKHIEENYMGKGSELVIDNKKDNWLKEAILDIGNFVKMFKNYGLDDKEIQLYTKENIIKFITNTGYNVEDRKILITIFAQKGLITENDIPAILKRNDSDLTKEILRTCMMGGTDALTTKKSGVNFVDPYELATFDPYNQRNLNDIPCTGKVRIIAETVEHIREKIMNKDDNYYKQDLEQAMENVYQHVIEKENTPLDVDLMARIFFDLYKINLEKTIERFNKLEQFDLYKEAFLKQKEEYEHKQEQKEQLEKTASDHLENEQYNEAIVILKEMLSLDPKDKDLEEIINDTEIQRANVIKKLTDKGKQEIFNEEYDTANETFKKLLELDKENSEIGEYLDIIRSQLSEKITTTLNEANKLYSDNEIDEAEEKYKKVLSYDPKHAESIQKISEIHQKQLNNKIESALQEIETYIHNEDFPRAKKEAKHIIEIIQDTEEEQEITYDDTNKIRNIFESIHKKYLEKINTLISQGKKHRDNNEEEKALEIFKQAELLKQNYEDM